MSKKNAVKTVRTARQRVVSFAKKAGSAVAMSAVSLSAFAQTATADMPTSLDGAVEFMQTKGGIAIAVAGAVTLITLGVTASKLPRKGS